VARRRRQSSARSRRPRNGKTADGKSIWAISKEVYVAVLNSIPLDEFLLSPEEDQQTAISGAVFNHATRMLGNSIKTAVETRFGNAFDHEGLVNTWFRI
jgi:hypothetical protein